MNETLREKTIVITGATSGIGLALSRLVVEKGARLIGVGHIKERCIAATDVFTQNYGKNRFVFIPAEISLLENVRELAHTIKRQLAEWDAHKLDTLVLNAAIVPFRQIITAEGFDTQWVVNYLSGFLLTHLLMDEMTAEEARIISVSSNSHYHARIQWNDLQLFRNYNPLLAYQQSKLAQVMFSAEFNRRMKGSQGIMALAVDPGLVKTEIGFKGDSYLMRLFWQIRRRKGRMPESAAEEIVFLMEHRVIPQIEQVYWKYKQPMMPNPLVLDQEAGRRLWEMSRNMSGLMKGKESK